MRRLGRVALQHQLHSQLLAGRPTCRQQLCSKTWERIWLCMGSHRMPAAAYSLELPHGRSLGISSHLIQAVLGLRVAEAGLRLHLARLGEATATACMVSGEETLAAGRACGVNKFRVRFRSDDQTRWWVEFVQRELLCVGPV